MSVSIPSLPILNERLDAMLQALARAEGMRTVTVSDEQGLPLCGTGEQIEGLAAFSGLLGEIELRAKSLLSIGGVRRITIETEQQATVSTCPLAQGDVRIALTTLSVGPSPDIRRYDEILTKVAAAIARERAN